MGEIWRRAGQQEVKIGIIVVLLILLVVLVLGGFGAGGAEKAARSAREREWLKGEGAFFVRKQCTNCHSVKAFGIESAYVGPDLSDAVVETERRFSKSIDKFLHNPSGTMSIVFAQRIPLTEAETQEAIRLLKVAYQRKLEQQSPLNQ